MDKAWTRGNRRRLGYSRRMLGWLVIGLVQAIAAMGCTVADIDLPDGTPGANDTTLPAALTRPRATRPPVPRLDPAASPAWGTSSIQDHAGADTSDSAESGAPGAGTIPGGTTLTINLTILAPTQGAALDIGAIRVLGVAWAGALVTVNGISTEVSPAGTFTRDLILEEGINSVEAIARDSSGQEVSESLVLLFVPRADGVPLSILFPQGLEVSDPDLTIMGATRPDAVVGVNGVPVEINGVGIFSTTVLLEEGTNLIEIVAVDLDENVNYQTVVVFYIP